MALISAVAATVVQEIKWMRCIRQSIRFFRATKPRPRLVMDLPESIRQRYRADGRQYPTYPGLKWFSPLRESLTNEVRELRESVR